MNQRHKNFKKLSPPFCQMVMMTQQGCPGCLPRPPVKTWHRLHRCLMAAVTSAWPPAVRRKEAQVCRTPASSVTSPSGIKLTHFVPQDAAGAPSAHNNTNVIFFSFSVQLHSLILLMNVNVYMNKQYSQYYHGNETNTDC